MEPRRRPSRDNFSYVTDGDRAAHSYVSPPSVAGTCYGVTVTFTIAVVQQHTSPPPPSPE